MKHYIAIVEIRSRVIEVEADNTGEAMNKVQEAYCENEINLNDYQYIDEGTQFFDETEIWSENTELTKHFLKIK